MTVKTQHQTATHQTHSFRIKLADRYRQFLGDQGATTFVSLAINQGSRELGWMRERLQKCVGKTERKLLGNRFYKLSPEQRLRGFFFPEKIDTNAHWHGIVKLPEHYVSCEFRHLQARHTFAHFWKSCVSSGNAKLDALSDDRTSCVAYITKECWRDDFWDQMVMLEDFWPASKTGRTR